MPLSLPIRAGILLALVVSPAVSQAQTDRFPGLWSPIGLVEGTAVLGDTLFVSGRFRSVGPSTGQLAVLDKTTGAADTAYPPVDAAYTSGVLVTLPDGAGGYYVGGAFSAVAERPRFNLAHVLADGTLDADFRPDPTTATGRGAVTSLALSSGGAVLYVGGEFDTVGGQARNALAALDAGTGAVLPFDAVLGRPGGATYGVDEVFAWDGVVYVGGDFQTVAGQPRPNAVALDGVTGAVLPWGAAPNGQARPVALGDSTVYLFGGFSAVDGQPRPNLAEVALYDPATGGGAVTAWTPAESVFGFEYALTPTALWVAPFVGGALRRFDRVTGAVTSGFPQCQSIRGLVYDPVGGAGTLYVGCERSDNPSGADRYPVVAAVDALTGQRTGFEVRGSGGTVGSLAVEPGPAGRLFVGGTFLTLGTGVAARQGLAALDLTTGRPTPFAATVAGPGQGLFEDLALSPDGRFLYGYSNVGGGAALRLTEFDLVTGATREFIPQGLTPATYGASAHVAGTDARTVGARGSATAAAANPRVENATSALVVTDTRLCLSINGVACYDRATATRLFYTPMVYVANLSENNGDLAYLPPGGPVQGPGGAGGTLYLAAPVAEAPPGTSRPALVAVDFETGAVLEQWTPGFNFAGAEGYALALFDRDGAGPASTALYAGGSRDWTVRGTSREALATFDPATAALGPWAPRVSGGTASVLSMATHRTPDGDGAVYVGGTLFFANGVRGRSAVAFGARVGVRRSWGENVTGTPRVMMVSERHGAVFVGGSVGLVGTGHSNLVALTPAAPILPTAGEGGVPNAAPVAASLLVAGPNPFRSQTALALTLPEAGPVEASLFDVLGRRVAVLHDGPLSAGTHTLSVDASALPAGVYVARVVGGSFTSALTITVVR